MGYNHKVATKNGTLPWAAVVLTCLCAVSVQAIDYHVDPSGAGGAYTTVQAALDAVAGQSPFNRANVLLAPGTYMEQVTLSKPYVNLIGQGAGPADVKITYNAIPVSGVSTGETFRVTGAATAFNASNLTFENSTPDQNITQALAVRSSADRAAWSNVRLLGYQDTLLVDNNSRQYFADSFITGDTDFIYGNATAVFDRATIESTDCCYVAAARTADTTANGLIFLDSSLVKGTDRSPADDGTTAQPYSVHLGRPWRSQDVGVTPSTIFVRTKMDDHIRAVGWDPWLSPAGQFDQVTRYSEYGSMDIGGNLLPLDSNGVPVGRVSWADPMTQAQADQYTLENIFGPVSFWNDHPEAQPEGTGVTYLPQGDGVAWDPVAQLELLNGNGMQPPPTHLYNIQLNGSMTTYAGAGQIGAAGDIWNNPAWTGVEGDTSLTLFSDLTVLDSGGADYGVSASLTAIYNTNSGQWNDGGVFNRYGGRANGSATLGLMDNVVKSDYWNGSANVHTLLLTGLLADTPVMVYVYGSGDGDGQGSSWSLDAANGGTAATIVYDASATGRDVTLASSQGTGWEVLAGTTDSSGNLTIVATVGQGSVWWQTYLNGIQVLLIPEVTGDFNDDLVIDGQDLLLWQRGGSPHPLSDSDLAAWQSNYGETLAEPTATSVPEPTALMLISLASLAAAVYSRRRGDLTRYPEQSCA